jgi:hypothetical protein
MYHVLDIMHAIHEASAEDRHHRLESGCPRPEPFELTALLEAAS